MGDSTPPRIGDAAKTRFLTGLRAGLKRDEAAAEAGFTANAFYYARQRDPVFDLACAWAMDLSAADQRASANASPPPAAPGETVIAPNSNRRLQYRPVRRPLFNDRRKRIFLDHFAGTADAHAACAAAGIAYSTFTQHRRNDPVFAADCDDALAVAYARLEAEAVRQRLEAQDRLREGLCPVGEMAMEFERVIKLLDRYRRPGGRIGFREVGPGRERCWSFEDSMAELDRKLRALGARHGIAPPEDGPPLLPAPPG